MTAIGYFVALWKLHEIKLVPPLVMGTSARTQDTTQDYFGGSSVSRLNFEECPAALLVL